MPAKKYPKVQVISRKKYENPNRYDMPNEVKQAAEDLRKKGPAEPETNTPNKEGVPIKVYGQPEDTYHVPADVQKSADDLASRGPASKKGQYPKATVEKALVNQMGSDALKDEKLGMQGSKVGNMRAARRSKARSMIKNRK